MQAPNKPSDPFVPRAEDFAPLVSPSKCEPVAKPGVLTFRDAVLAEYGEMPGAGLNIVRACTGTITSAHQEGRAWDWFPLTPQHAQSLLASLNANNSALARRIGLQDMIWQGEIWRSYAHSGFAPGQWGPYSGDNKHVDHIHFTFSFPGALGQTSFYLDPLVSSWEGVA